MSNDTICQPKANTLFSVIEDQRRLHNKIDEVRNVVDGILKNVGIFYPPTPPKEPSGKPSEQCVFDAMSDHISVMWGDLDSVLCDLQRLYNIIGEQK